MLPDSVINEQLGLPDIARSVIETQQIWAFSHGCDCEILPDRRSEDYQMLPDRFQSDALKAQNDALRTEIDALNIKASKKALDRYYDILSLLYSNEEIALKDITHSLSASRATVPRYLLSLIDRGVVETIGSKKTRKYDLNDALKTKNDALKVKSDALKI